MTIKDFTLVGKTYGHLTVTAEGPRKIAPNGQSLRVWVCTCQCGNQIHKITSQFARPSPDISCGCSKSDAIARLSTKHGESRRVGRTPEYATWRSMHRRCERPASADFKYYGARGISVCERWEKFPAFLEDMGRRPSPSHSIDRIDVNGNYELSNCRWATPLEQSQNRRCVVNARASK